MKPYDIQLTPHFKMSEFVNMDTLVPADVVSNIMFVAFELEKIRTFVDSPIVINSGYRTLQQNQECGGVSNSFHLKGYAVDIRCQKLDPTNFANAILDYYSNQVCDFDQLIVYKSFVHLGFNPNRNRHQLILKNI